jgi:serine/threonine-protein kinase
LSSTRAGQLKGKLAYMAPEQADGESEIDQRADIFSAGVVLWEVLAGRRLFKSTSEAATLNRVMKEPIVHPSDLNPAVDRAVGDVCLRALSRDLDTRFASAAQFAEALEQVAERIDWVGTQKDVAAFVDELIGDEIAEQRDAVRSWASQSGTEYGLESSVSRSYPALPRPSEPSNPRLTPASSSGFEPPKKKSRAGAIVFFSLLLGGGAAAAVHLGFLPVQEWLGPKSSTETSAAQPKVSDGTKQDAPLADLTKADESQQDEATAESAGGAPSGAGAEPSASAGAPAAPAATTATPPQAPVVSQRAPVPRRQARPAPAAPKPAKKPPPKNTKVDLSNPYR